MNKKILLLIFILTMVSACHFSPSLFGQVTVLSQKTELVSLDPADPSWDKASPSVVPLMKQAFVYPHGGGAVTELEVRSLYTDKEISFYLSWKDPNKSSMLDVSGKFTDGCAIQIPLKSGVTPNPFMGEKGKPVNIWRWKAVAHEEKKYIHGYSDYHRPDAIETKIKTHGMPVENLVAEGFGTLTPLPDQEVEGAGKWFKGRWEVVIKRGLKSKTGALFKIGSEIPIAFAVWEGGSKERNGMKSVTFWQNLKLLK